MSPAGVFSGNQSDFCNKLSSWETTMSIGGGESGHWNGCELAGMLQKNIIIILTLINY